MKDLIEKYGDSKKIYNDPTSREVYELHVARTKNSMSYISSKIRSRTTLFSFFMIHNRNEVKEIIIKNLRKDNERFRKEIDELKK